MPDGLPYTAGSTPSSCGPVSSQRPYWSGCVACSKPGWLTSPISLNREFAQARVDGLQQVGGSQPMLRHPVPENLIAGRPQQPGISALTFVVAQRRCRHPSRQRHGKRFEESRQRFCPRLWHRRARAVERPMQQEQHDRESQRGSERRAIQQLFPWHPLPRPSTGTASQQFTAL